MARLGTAKTKNVLCTHCGKPNEVGLRAMSVFCAHCRKRLILENVSIKSYQGVKGYATCGDVVVEKSGRVNVAIQAGNLTIKGHVKGDVLARGTIQVTKSGVLMGNVVAHALNVVPGASIDAVCRIGPPPVQEQEPAVEPVAVQKQTRKRRPQKESQPLSLTLDPVLDETPQALEKPPIKVIKTTPSRKVAKPAQVKVVKTKPAKTKRKVATPAGKKTTSKSSTKNKKPATDAAKKGSTGKTAKSTTASSKKKPKKSESDSAKKTTKKTVKKITTRRSKKSK